MNEPDQNLTELLMRMFSASDQKLSTVLTALKEFLESFPIELPAFLCATLLSDAYSRHMRIGALAFLGHLQLSGIGVPPGTFAAVLARAAAHERFLLYEIIVKKNIDVVP